MNRWKRLLQQCSRSRSVLWGFGLSLLVLGGFLGYSVHLWRPSSPERIEDRILAAIGPGDSFAEPSGEAPDLSALVLAALHRELADPAARFEPVLDFMPTLADLAPSADRAQVLSIVSSRFSQEQSALGADLFAVCHDKDAEARKRLEDAANMAAPVRYASHALGLAERARDEMHAASAHFRKEGLRPEAVGSRRQAVECLWAVDDYDLLTALKGMPEYTDLIPASIALSAAIHQRDWPAILRAVPLSQFTELDPSVTALTLVAGIAWALVLVHLGELPGVRSGSALLCLLGFIAGVVSTTPTIYAVVWQDDMLGFSPDGDFLRTAVYFVGGVGVREELCKLALFVPFLPFLIRRGDELEALIVASFVGLGFAIEENGNYFLGSGGTSVAARFLTANFFHVALTGLNGLALFRACTRGMAGLNELLYVLGVTVIAHGLYDALLDLPDPDLGGYLSLAIYMLTCRLYFQRAHELRNNVRMTLSLSGAFVAGVSLLACAMIIFQMARLGPGTGLLVVVPELIGSMLLLLIFFREFDEALAA